MEKRIRVVQMFYTFDVEVGGGGLTRFAIELGKKLDPQLFEVSLVSLGFYSTSQSQSAIEQLKNEGFIAFEATHWIEEKPYTSFFNSVKFLSRALKAYKVDILHSHSEYTDLAAILLKLQAKAPLIMRTVHYGFQYEWRTKPLRRLLTTNFIYPLMFNREIGVSQTITSRLNHRRVARFIRSKSRCIYNAIPLDGFIHTQVDIGDKKLSLGIPPEAPVIGSVGRLADQKAYNYLLDAIPTVIQGYPEARFLVVGDGPLAEDLRNQAEQLGVASSIIFTGGRPDVAELLRCMDLFVSSSLWEGLPTVIMEAMASGVPVIATDIPGTNELIEHAHNGWLVPPADGQAVAQAILHLLGSPQLRVDLSKRGLEKVNDYSIESIARQYEDLYLGIKVDR